MATKKKAAKKAKKTSKKKKAAGSVRSIKLIEGPPLNFTPKSLTLHNGDVLEFDVPSGKKGKLKLILEEVKAGGGGGGGPVIIHS